ncbi:hypothetical protein QOZ88_17660 [Blastococcus sp. BMG 814]|uniref:Thioesterase superfamily protein n=1 Tax=Blastococcus carthaginiensis TaxID=3050034 RepID=A0ABT9IFX2_9ACTN|nr:hypothetical protein [Blastococcus carthaginiensis]MDP5184466.1 hypothetical protein [Blastococcus carthaginiensis]
MPRTPPAPAVPGSGACARTRGEHLTACEAEVEQEGKALVHAVATFALLER